MTLLLQLLLAHFFGDFVLQRGDWVADKVVRKWRSPKLYLHVSVHLAMMILLVHDIRYAIGIVIITISHLLIDIWKLTVQNNDNQRIVFVIDQVMHLLVIVGVAEYYTGVIRHLASDISYDHILLLVLCIIIVTAASSHIVRVLISRWAPEQEDESGESLSDAGRYIGMLERLFIFGFVVSGYVTGVGFLLAAKSIFRFGDLRESKDRKLTEYILIGTLVSFGIAMLVSIFYVYILGRLS